jgi:hypothetical protein
MDGVVRTRPKRRDLVKVIDGPARGRVGMVVAIAHDGPGQNRYQLPGSDDQLLGWFEREAVEVVAYRPRRVPMVWVAEPAPHLDAVERMLRPKA